MDVQRSERGIQHVVDEREQRAENDFSEAETGVFTGTQCRMTFQSGTSQGVEAAHETANTEQACHCQQGVDGFSPLTKRGCGGPGNAVKGGHFKAKLRTGSIHERLQTCQAGTEEETEQCLPCIHLTAPVSPAVGAGQNQRKPCHTNERALGDQKGETGAVDVVAKTDDG